MVGPPSTPPMRPSSPDHRPPTAAAAPPEAWEPLVRLGRLAGRPLERFLRIEAASGVVLVVTALVALAWATFASASYEAVWQTPVGVRIGGWSFEQTLAWVVNDGLMVVFFFVVGMEIRRELHHGELSEWRRAALPALAALGGMIAPALLYLSVASTPAARSGWGVPMATDIAFAVGVLALLGKRVPAALRVLLLALAVIDDLGAIVVIALFYSSGVAPIGLGVAALGVAAILAMQRFGVRTKLLYVAPALVAWAGVYAAGVHPTIAGVIVGLLTPVRAWLGHDGFIRGLRKELDALAAASPAERSSRELAEHLGHVDAARREAISPAESLIERLHPWVAFGIMPLFALANAGVHVEALPADMASLAAMGGVMLGLVVGKPLGILVTCFLAVRLRVATLPAGIGARQLVVLGAVAGIGFTMSIFVASLAFTGPAQLAAAKLGVLAGSAIAAVLALALGRWLLPVTTSPAIAASADEAESSTEQ